MASLLRRALPLTRMSPATSALRQLRLSSHSIQVNNDNFDETIAEATKPVLVYFTASWCGPCRMLKPILEKAVDARNGDVVLAKIDVDEQQELSARFQVASVPQVFAVKEGEIVDQFIGAQPLDKVNSFLDKIVKA
ncbi:uncharacterized protein MONBRDRAFT_12274 [Monosiga brevicollis MX1]|uniref:Thioredoxin domain-containing protein n=1 Tax=Monosiga brevicollis TaxID=81824 RepID=A9VBR7_MONBE|nr:uncharacterized protein MONBRDRAFT_12274 [Monosiga brevicollis MX1]EDQ84980.1 predicted protein [Monosiga brevicollis MX1]|eukprot:XP_001750150.1 hypothetical protein [Monosiga brevicollis MX1]